MSARTTWDLNSQSQSLIKPVRIVWELLEPFVTAGNSDIMVTKTRGIPGVRVYSDGGQQCIYFPNMQFRLVSHVLRAWLANLHHDEEKSFNLTYTESCEGGTSVKWFRIVVSDHIKGDPLDLLTEHFLLVSHRWRRPVSDVVFGTIVVAVCIVVFIIASFFKQ